LFSFLKTISFLVINRAAFYVVLHSFQENAACVIKIMPSSVKISGGITISASQPDIIVNLWKKDYYQLMVNKVSTEVQFSPKTCCRHSG
jgi:hypothetical protein